MVASPLHQLLSTMIGRQYCQDSLSSMTVLGFSSKRPPVTLLQV